MSLFLYSSMLSAMEQPSLEDLNKSVKNILPRDLQKYLGEHLAIKYTGKITKGVCDQPGVPDAEMSNPIRSKKSFVFTSDAEVVYTPGDLRTGSLSRSCETFESSGRYLIMETVI